MTKGPNKARADSRRWAPKRPARRSIASDDGVVLLYGTHAVAAALANPARVIDGFHATAAALPRFEQALSARGATARVSDSQELERMLPRDAVHQGVVLRTRSLPEVALQECDALGLPERRHSLVLVLDQITDPHNVGAILRSAAAFGATALVMTARHSPPLDGALAKAASGGLEVVPIAKVPNLARALEHLADLGFLCAGLDGAGKDALEQLDVDRPIALVLGAESTGMRRLTAEHCDVVCRISTTGTIASLNVSNAAAIALYSVRSRQAAFVR